MSNAYFYCQNCFKSSSVDLTCLEEAAQKMKQFKNNNSGIFDYISGYICPHCGCYHSTFLIDEDMLPVISLLNGRGYETIACCSGHDTNSPFYSKSRDAYVLIKYSKTLDKYLKICKKYKMIDALQEHGIEFSISINKSKENDSTIRIGVSYTDAWLSINSLDNVDSVYLTSRLSAILLSVPVNTDTKNGIFRKNSYINDDGVPYIEE